MTLKHKCGHCGGEIHIPLGVSLDEYETGLRKDAVVEAAIAWANAEYDDDYVEEQTLLSRVNYLRKLEGESDG